MRYLVTGGGGQLGREWDRYLRSKGADYRCLNRKEGDVTDHVQMEKMISDYQPNVIVNCAAYTKVDEAEEQKELAEKINSEAPAFLARLCKEKGILLVHYSTDYVFPGRASDQQDFQKGYPEDADTDPINEYGSSKRKGELAIQSSGCEYLIFRVSWLCGAYGNNFVKTMLRLADEKKELSVVDDQIGCPSFTSPVVRNSDIMIGSSQRGLFHLRSAGKATWYDLASKTFEYQGKSIKLNAVNSEAFPTKARRPGFSLLQIDKIREIEGVEIRPWEADLKEMLDQIEE